MKSKIIVYQKSRNNKNIKVNMVVPTGQTPIGSSLRPEDKLKILKSWVSHLENKKPLTLTMSVHDFNEMMNISRRSPHLLDPGQLKIVVNQAKNLLFPGKRNEEFTRSDQDTLARFIAQLFSEDLLGFLDRQGKASPNILDVLQELNVKGLIPGVGSRLDALLSTISALRTIATQEEELISELPATISQVLSPEDFNSARNFTDALVNSKHKLATIVVDDPKPLTVKGNASVSNNVIEDNKISPQTKKMPIISLKYDGESPWILAWSPDSRFLGAVSHDNILTTWDIKTAKKVQVNEMSEERIMSLTWLFNGEHWTASEQSQDPLKSDNVIQYIQDISCSGGFCRKIIPISLSPDGNTLIFSDEKQTKITIWDTKIKSPITTSSFRGLSSIAWSPDSRFFVLGYLDHSIKILDTNGNLLKQLTINNNTSPLKEVVWSPDGKMLATMAKYGEINILDGFKGLVVDDFSVDIGGLEAIAWSPDSKLLAISGKDKTIQIWQISNE